MTKQSLTFIHNYFNLLVYNNFYTQVVDSGHIIKSFFWIIMDHYSQDAHWMMITSNQILGGISKWYIIAIICYL